MNPKKINECFAELIAERAWYKNTTITRKMAYRDKARFRKGELAESKMRYYLTHAGYTLSCAEMWVKKNMNVNQNENP
jgi:hypothetical protein